MAEARKARRVSGSAKGKKGPGKGRAKIVPLDWQRRAYSLEPGVIYALEVQAAKERMPVSLLVNRALKEFTKRRGGT